MFNSSKNHEICSEFFNQTIENFETTSKTRWILMLVQIFYILKADRKKLKNK